MMLKKSVFFGTISGIAGAIQMDNLKPVAERKGMQKIAHEAGLFINPGDPIAKAISWAKGSDALHVISMAEAAWEHYQTMT